MEANTIVNTNSTVVVEKKMRKPSLPAKFAKFIQFGYFFVKQYNAMDGVTPIDETSFLDKLHLFDTVDNQQAFVQSFFDDAKNINKTIRKLVQAKVKADAKAAAPPKVKATRVKKPKADVATDSTADGSADGSAEPSKTSRRKKKIAVVPDVQDDLINELTSLANNTALPTIQPTSQPTTEPTTKTEKKPKAEKKPKVEKPKAESKPKVEKPKVEKKPKAQKKTLTQTQPETQTQTQTLPTNHIDLQPELQHELDDNDNDIITSPIIIDGKQFLIDDSNYLYDFDYHHTVGKLVDNTISPL